ncbi:hypothetical protein HII31_00898 [Pseudocercospora fuligena]|uniref:CCHC-type domain-containing protein n=1 Tax=Pseudocercospora fuligena TaxID=685502 RepID=A0A8H6RV58_9PEZI|nr:hypothetical protein HII31_00898 [Pseudocercospora fuligena]
MINTMAGYQKPNFVPNSKHMSKDRTSKFDKQCKDCKFWVNNEKHKNEGKKNTWCPANPAFKLCTKCEKAGHKTEECGKNGNDRSNNNNNNNDRDNRRNQNSNAESSTNARNSDGRVPFTTNNGNNSKNDKVEKNLHGLVAIQSSNHYPVDLSKGESSKIAEMTYCAYCNNRKHWTHKCEDVHSIARVNGSTLACTACHSRGHTIDECQCPVSEPCAKCAKRGHATSECKSNKEATVYDQYFNKTGWAKRDPHGRRFQWSSEGILLHEAQLKRQQFLLDQAEVFAQDGKLSDEYKRARQQSIEDAERSIFEKKKPQVFDSMSDIEYASPRRRSSARGRANTQYKIPGPTPSYSRSNTNSSGNSFGGLTHNHQYNADLNVIRQMASKGASRAVCHQFEAALHSLRSKEISDIELQVRNKCLVSRKLTTLQNMNYKILQNENLILERGVLTTSKMNEVKMALYQGAQIYRDPKAMEALFAREVPRCAHCGTEGIFVDRHFVNIPWNSKTSDLLGLEEIQDWGVFVVFDCVGRCSVGGFSYERRYVSDEVCFDEQDLEYRAWEV